MLAIPAIDLKNGKVVRLSQGKFDEMTIYSSRPIDVAREWENAGAKALHIIDLDGAQKGRMGNLSIIKEIASTVSIPVQVGGGIRTKEDVKKVFSGGITRIILGTKVIDDMNFLKDLIDEWGTKIVVSLDCTRGFVTKHGWTATSDLKATEFAKRLEGAGLGTLIYTDITRDGTLAGPNIDGIREILNSVNIPVIASGGVSSLKDITALRKMGSEGLSGIIIGKALYERTLYLRDIIELCSRNE